MRTFNGSCETGGVSRGAVLAQGQASFVAAAPRETPPVSQEGSGVFSVFRRASRLCRKCPRQASLPQQPASHLCGSLHEVR